tara:strand:+ start:2015 stop:2227 length:213 start_codon:yes stop_codon:yes gene_type:complete
MTKLELIVIALIAFIMGTLFLLSTAGVFSSIGTVYYDIFGLLQLTIGLILIALSVVILHHLWRSRHHTHY